MDTFKTPEQTKAKVAADIKRIQQHMPGVYKAIKDNATEIGDRAYLYVKQACAGKPNTFYAMENGHIVGTRFELPEIDRDIAWAMCAFGIDFMVVWPEETAKGGA